MAYYYTVCITLLHNYGRLVVHLAALKITTVVYSTVHCHELCLHCCYRDQVGIASQLLGPDAC